MSALIPPAPAAELPVRNLGFESWDALGRPEGWHVGNTKAYRASADCDGAREGRCALKLESLPGENLTFVPIVQGMDSRHAAGHFIRLSGMIRTRDVTGWAGLWLRVDAPERPNLALENMSRTGPRGTTPWQRFSITLPVAPNTSHVAFGGLLSGSGTAWFDDMPLVVYTSTRVEPEPVVAAPPRPKPDPSLLDDAAMALPAADRPKVRAEWAVDVASRARAIRSLFSDDYSDLAFLKPLLEGRRVVQLGESGHGVAEFNWLKVRLVKYLHRELGYDVMAFESSLSGCDLADKRIGIDPPIEVMRQCIFPVWHSSETLGLFEYLEGVRKQGRRISLAGFDTQNSGTASAEAGRRLVAMADLVNPELGRAVDSHDRRIATPHVQILLEEAEHMSQTYLALAVAFAAGRGRIEASGKFGPRDVDLAIQEARSRSRLALQRVHGRGPREGSLIRDEGMAENLDFVLDKLYPGRKVIVWAHNFHIAKSREGFDEPQAMGAWVDKRRGREVYTVGLYMGRGAAARNDRKVYAIAPPPEDSMEAVLASAGLRMAFVDFSRAEPGAGTGWIFEPIVAREWGSTRTRIRPARAYDGVIYIDTVTPPEYR